MHIFLTRDLWIPRQNRLLSLSSLLEGILGKPDGPLNNFRRIKSVEKGEGVAIKPFLKANTAMVAKMKMRTTTATGTQKKRDIELMVI